MTAAKVVRILGTENLHVDIYFHCQKLLCLALKRLDLDQKTVLAGQMLQANSAFCYVSNSFTYDQFSR